MRKIDYLMENDEEILRLEAKTSPRAIEKQAKWAGIKSGMRVADICCGTGKTTSVLHRLVQPGGTVVGIDGSEERLAYATNHYGRDGIQFVLGDIREKLTDLGMFDFVWVRFVLEYFRAESFDIARNVSAIVGPGSILCLIDLDYNCLSHYGLPEKLERTIAKLMAQMERDTNFDPYVGRKLYSMLYHMGFDSIKLSVSAHNLIYGRLREVDAFNWRKKIEIGASKVDFDLSEYGGSYEEFMGQFTSSFSDPARFSYTPMIFASGRKPKPNQDNGTSG
jgi:ubiquinone/menaquinone biosynthesis C-methylase UbiE